MPKEIDNPIHHLEKPVQQPSDPPACPHRTAAAGYEIRVRDHLETYWNEWFEGWSITNLENGEVLMRTPSLDQSALHGALNKIRDLNLTLISVTRLLAEK